MDTGGKIRTGKILEQLNKCHDITIISNVESPKDDKHVDNMDNLCSRFVPVPWKEVKKNTFIFYIKLLFQMFSRYPVSVLNDYSKNLESKIKECMKKEKHDLLICDFVQSALMFKNINGIPMILFQHNLESMIAKRHLDQTTNIVAKIFWWLQWKKMFSFEAEMCKKFDTVIAVSDKDQEAFELLYNADNIQTIPTGVDVDFFNEFQSTEMDEMANGNSLVFCGSMDWLPNEDAIFFFVNDILPRLNDRVANVKLVVVGRNPSPRLINVLKNYCEVELTGRVEDIRPYIAKSALYIVPIRIGGGTRMKIYEAMAMGKTIVSTSIGAEGLPVRNGENIVIEDDPIRFGGKIVDLLGNMQKRKEIGVAAYDFVYENFTWQKVAEKFSEICQKTIRGNIS